MNVQFYGLLGLLCVERSDRGTSLFIAIAASTPYPVTVANSTCRDTGTACGPAFVAFHFAQSERPVRSEALDPRELALTCRFCILT